MNRCWIAVAVCYLSITSGALAQTTPPQGKTPAAELPDVTKTEFTLEKLDQPAEREIKFERTDVEFTKRLTRPDPKLLEQKYVAILRLANAKRVTLNGSSRFVYIGSLGGNHASLDYRQLAKLQQLHGVMLVSGDQQSSESLKDSLSRFIEHVPTKRLPDDEQLAFFKSDDPDRGFMNIVDVSDSRAPGASNYTEIQILAPTPEIAEVRVKTLLRLLDQGGSRAIQTAMFEYRQTRAREWKETRDKMIAVEKQIDEAQKQLASFAGFTSDMLASLNQQQLQLDVALVGAKARLATCDTLLGELPANAARAKVEEVKFTTMIEVAGIEASQKRTNELLKSMHAKNDLANHLKTLTSDRERFRGRLTVHAEALVEADAVIAQNAPLALVDGKVLIQPVLWTQ